jgi:hypothetical protein
MGFLLAKVTFGDSLNDLAMTGDYPVSGTGGLAKPEFSMPAPIRRPLNW